VRGVAGNENLLCAQWLSNKRSRWNTAVIGKELFIDNAKRVEIIWVLLLHCGVDAFTGIINIITKTEKI